MTTTIDTAAVRAALVPATARDLERRPTHRRRVRRIAIVATLTLGASTGVAAATGVIFAPPKPDPAVPIVAEWTYFEHNPYGHGEGPVLLREKTDSLQRANRAAETALAARGVDARCGTDAGHPHACFLPSGDPVAGSDLATVLGTGGASSETDYDVRPLTAAEGHAWLCTHPGQRPGADFGEKPAPTAGYEDC